MAVVSGAGIKNRRSAIDGQAGEPRLEEIRHYQRPLSGDLDEAWEVHLTIDELALGLIAASMGHRGFVDDILGGEHARGMAKQATHRRTNGGTVVSWAQQVETGLAAWVERGARDALVEFDSAFRLLELSRVRGAPDTPGSRQS